MYRNVLLHLYLNYHWPSSSQLKLFRGQIYSVPNICIISEQNIIIIIITVEMELGSIAFGAIILNPKSY